MKNDCRNCKHNQGQVKHKGGSITTDCALTDCVPYPLKSRCKAWLALEKDEQGYYIRHHPEIKAKNELKEESRMGLPRLILLTLASLLAFAFSFWLDSKW